METLALHEIVRRMDGTLAQGDGAIPVRRLHTDSRTLEPGDCFLALSGERFDGHRFIAEAPATGAVAAVVSRLPEQPLPENFGLVTVTDTLVALQKFSASYRSSHVARIVAVTGSSGKTSTKEMIASVLRQKFRTVATQGNLNNHIGVPLTLLQIVRDTEYAVVEMGMNHRGEIAALAGIAAPDIAVVTTAGSAHIENLGTRDAIADEKTDLIAALPSDGIAVLNTDDVLLAARAHRAPGRVVSAGFGATADWTAREVRITPQGIEFVLVDTAVNQHAPVRLPLFNRVMVGNALLAAAVGKLAGLTLHEIVRGLEAVRLVGKRMEVKPRLGGWLIDDCYNANPESMKGALEALREFPAPARRVAVLGSMGELGAQAAALHRETGAAAARANIGLLVLVGPNAADLAAGAREAGFPAEALVLFDQTAAAAAALPGLALPDDTLLVKGSRFLKLEQLVVALTPTAPSNETPS